MSTAPIAIFCTTLEGLDLACRVADKLERQPAIFSFLLGSGFKRITKEEVVEGLQLRIFFTEGAPAAPTLEFDAFVETQASTITVDIKIGGLIPDPPTLLLSQFDTGRATSAAATSALSWLKRQIKSEVKFGVTGTNQTTGGSSAYKNMGYTQGALALLDQGGVWKNDRTGRSTFQPTAAWMQG